MSFNQRGVEREEFLTGVRVEVDEFTGHIGQHGKAVGVEVLVFGVSHVEVHHFYSHQNEDITCTTLPII